MEAVNESTRRAFKKYLNEEYLGRCQKNPSYSLRSYAKSLSIDPTFLSRIMKGEQSLTTKTIKRLMLEFDMSLESLLQITRNEALSNIKFFSHAEFSLISKWYFFAILDLVDLPNFESSTSFVAKSLGLREFEASAAIEVLVEAGYLNISEEPWKNNLQASDWNNHDVTSTEKKNFQKQILKKAIEAVDEVEIADRYNSSLSLKFDRKLLPEVKKKILDFKEDLDTFIEESSKDKDSIFQLAIAFFPLTKKGDKS